MMAREHEIFVVRHGETEWSADGRHTGRTDIPLTAAGERQARAAGHTLTALRGTGSPPALVLCSPSLRTRRTAELAGLLIDDITDQLVEWDYGDYEGRTTLGIREQVPQWTIWTHPVPGGEDAEAVSARARTVLNRSATALAYGDVVLVSHGHISRVLIAGWLGMAPSMGVHYGVEAAAISVLGHERGVAQLTRLNVPPLRDRAT